MTTTRAQVKDALKGNDQLTDLVCFWRSSDRYNTEPGDYPLTRCSGNTLPEREFHAGYGGIEGEECVCYSDQYIYVKVVYDGMEWFDAVPRHPEGVDLRNIPLLGGG